MKTSTISNVRIILAISTKDLTDSIKNKHVLSVILPALVVIILYRFVPMMGGSDRPARLRLAPGGNEAAAEALEQDSAYRLIRFETPADLQYGLTNEELPEIALLLPDGFDESVADGNALAVQGFMLEFFTPEQIAQTRSATEAEMEAVLGTPVTIQVQTIPLQVDSYGVTVLTSLALTFGIVMVGVVALPYMILEEKDGKTLDVMLVSPANPGHVVLAKSLSGLVITFSVFVLALLFYRHYIVHWWLIALCGLLGTGFAVSLGVGLGFLVDNRQNLVLYGWIIILPLFLPLILVVMDELIPAGWISLLNWFPTVAIMRLVRTSMAGSIGAAYYLPQIFVLLICTVLVLGFDTWLVRRMDR